MLISYCFNLGRVNRMKYDSQVVHPGIHLQCRRCKRCGFNLWVRKCNPLQYSSLENSMYRGAWWTTVHGVTELNVAEPLNIYTQAHTHVHTHKNKLYWCKYPENNWCRERSKRLGISWNLEPDSSLFYKNLVSLLRLSFTTRKQDNH